MDNDKRTAYADNRGHLDSKINLDPNINLDKKILQNLLALAKEFGVKKMALFGSRARGDCHERSDIDLAVWGIGDARLYLDFEEAVEERTMTLLSFDIVDMDGLAVSNALWEEIKKDGIVLYEKI